MDGRVRFVIPSSLRDGHGGPLEWAEGYYPAWPALALEVIQPLFLTTPTVALVVLFPNGTITSALDTLANHRVDRVGGNDLVPAAVYWGA